MKKYFVLLLLSFILTSCFGFIQDKKETNSVDKSSPKKVVVGYVKSMEKCDINTAINYFDPVTAEVFKKGITGMIQDTFDIMNNFSDAIGVNESEKNKFKEGQEKINGSIKATGIDKVDYNQICKDTDLYFKDFKILDDGDINGNIAVFKVSYNFQGDKITEDWKVIKNGKIWDLVDDGDYRDTTIENETSNNENIIIQENEEKTESEILIEEKNKEESEQKDTLSDELSFDQKEQIRYGQDAGIDTSIYENVKFSVDQMKEIRYGLESKVDAKIYANPDFSVGQMREIRYGLESGIEVGSYAKIDLSVDEMQSKRHKLEDEKEY